MKKDACSRIGKLFKSHGIKGELSVLFESSWVWSKNFRKQKFLFVEVYPGDELVPFFIESAEADESGKGKIKLEDYDSIASVKLLSNKEIFIPAEIFTLKPGKKNAGNELVGFSVIDKNEGSLGIVKDVLESAMQSTLVLMKDGKEILIPMADDLVIKLNKKEKKILMEIPPGLLDLNAH